MVKTLDLRRLDTKTLRRRKTKLLKGISAAPANAIRGSCVEQFLTCGKKNCRCRGGRKHGPFHYLVQCLGPKNVRKFLLKTSEARKQANAGIKSYLRFQAILEELSQINAELLRRENFDELASMSKRNKFPQSIPPPPSPPHGRSSSPQG